MWNAPRLAVVGLSTLGAEDEGSGSVAGVVEAREPGTSTAITVHRVSCQHEHLPRVVQVSDGGDSRF